MARFWLVATMGVAMMTGVAVAQTASSVGPTGPQQPGVEEPMMTSPGSAVMPGHSGSMAATTMPDSGGHGLPMYTDYSGPMATAPGFGSRGMPMDDGNATRMIAPGQPPKLISEPE
jgi:hypothetical protein